MTEHEFSIVATRDDRPACGDPDVFGEWMLDIAEALAEHMGGEPDVSVSGHADGLELIFHRENPTLSGAIASAMQDIGAVGLQPLSGDFAQLACN